MDLSKYNMVNNPDGSISCYPKEPCLFVHYGVHSEVINNDKVDAYVKLMSTLSESIKKIGKVPFNIQFDESKTDKEYVYCKFYTFKEEP